jgi:hypothetical protein
MTEMGRLLTVRSAARNPSDGCQRDSRGDRGPNGAGWWRAVRLLFVTNF